MPQYDDIDAMLGLGMEDPNRMAAGLRRQAFAGDIMAASNIGNMQRGGLSGAENARAGAKQAGVFKRARDAENKRAEEDKKKDERALAKSIKIANIKPASSQHGRFTFPKMKDAYGNEVIMKADKESGTLSPMSFVGGAEWTDEEAKNRGGKRSTQKGDEALAVSGSQYSIKRQGELMESSQANAQTLNSIDQAIKALDAGAGSGWFESKLPSLRPSSIALDNARENLALTQIGQFTFGSLSEAEGDWLRGSVMPQLDEDDLMKYMVHRKEATMRVMEATAYEREALMSGEEIDIELINAILSDGGFNIAEDGWED